MRVSDAILWVDALLTGAAIAWALTVRYLTVPDFSLLRRLFWAIAVGLWVFAAVWNVTSNNSPWVRLPLAAAIFAISGIFLVEGIRWTYRAEIALPKPEIPASLYAAQLAELREIDAFIGNKDEMELRQTFDLPNMIRFNTLMAKGRLFVWGLTPEEGKKVDEFFAGGKAQIDIRYAKVTSVNNAAQYEPIPGKFGLMNLSKKYADNLKRLNEYVASATIPDDVKKALTDFRDTIVADTSLIFDVINGCFQENSAQVIQNDTYGAQFYGSVTGAYAGRFLALRPKADVVSAAIRKYLGVR